MQKRKKQLLGLSGLAAVGVMTAVAMSLPASAETTDVYQESANSATTQVTVNVQSSRIDVRIVSPKNGEQITEGTSRFTVVASHAKTIQPYLTYKDTSGTLVERALPAIETNGQVTVSGDLILPLAETEYTLRVVAVSADGEKVEDSITFSYRAVSVVSKGETAENNDPIIHITANKSVNKLQIQAYSQKGDKNPVFVDADGEQEALILDRSALNEDGYIMLALPFEKYKAQAGTYDVVVVAYGDDGKVISMNRVEVKYSPKASEVPGDPDAPEVPGTGSMLLDNLNISRIDYLLTGLIAFGAVTGFALYLVFRKNRR